MPLADLSRDELTALHAAQTEAYDALVGQGTEAGHDPRQAVVGSARPVERAAHAAGARATSPTPPASTAATTAAPPGCSEIREIFAPLLNVPVAQLVAGDNASLSIMHDTIVYSLLKGTVDSDEPWVKAPIKFICPVPGYDRHFALCEQFGIEMIPVPLNADGPDLDAVRKLVADDAAVKGMWIVPTYANPTGVGLHRGGRPGPGRDAGGGARLPDLLGQRVRRAPPDRGREPGAGHPGPGRRRPATRTGPSCSRRPRRSPSPAPGCRSSRARPANVAWYLQHLSKRTIGPDKVNHLRHARYLQEPRRRARTDAPAPRDPGAEVRAGERDPGRPARRARGGDLDHTRRVATSSASTSPTAPRPGSSRWPRRPASR